MKAIRFVLPPIAIAANFSVMFGVPLVPPQTGAFGPQQVITFDADFGLAASVYAVDLDGDGDSDVLSASGADGKIAWYENLDGGAFGSQQVISMLAGGNNSVYAVDLDGDGDADVLSASGNQTKIAWYENQGGGVFGLQQVIGWQEDASFHPKVYAADLDGDGDADVLSTSSAWNASTSDWEDKIAWYENLGGGVFGVQQVITTQLERVTDIYATDLDDDGDVDVLSASLLDKKIAWYENQGGGVFGEQQVIATQASNPRSVYAEDLDGDGDADVLSASDGVDKIAWYENQGNGAFGGKHVLTEVGNAASVYATDLDGDGDADVLSACITDDKIAWYENQGGGAFGTQQVISTQAIPFVVYAADLDGDGDADVLSANVGPSGFEKIAWYENLTGPYDCNGNGTPDPDEIAADPSLDCNGNGIPDDCDIASGVGKDQDGNGILDDCGPDDCNGNGTPDPDEITADPSLDCNGNGVPDECDIASDSSLDQDGNGILDECLPPPLASNPVQISVASGGQHDLSLTAPQEYGNSLYFVLGSSSGTVPGITLDGVLVPLQIFDPYFLYGVSSPNVSPFINTLGSLSATGTASAAIAVPSGLTDLAGVTIHHAYVLFGNSLEVVYASNAAPLELVP